MDDKLSDELRKWDTGGPCHIDTRVIGRWARSVEILEQRPSKGDWQKLTKERDDLLEDIAAWRVRADLDAEKIIALEKYCRGLRDHRNALLKQAVAEQWPDIGS